MTVSIGGSDLTTVKAHKEVILSAGMIGTTQILQLSGIGNADKLKMLNIPVLINNPAAGANLIDHILLPNIFNVKGNESLDLFLRDPNILGAVINQWTANRTRVVANSAVNTFGFARLPNNLLIFKTVADPASGPKSPHWEMVFIVRNSKFYFGQCLYLDRIFGSIPALLNLLQEAF